MTKDDNKKIVFKPISATAKKIGEVDGEDILNINIPFEEDVQTVKNIIENRAKESGDYIYKYNESKYNENKYNKDKYDNEHNKGKGDDMDEDTVMKLFDDKMAKTKLNEMIDEIKKVTKDVDARTKEIDKKIEQKIDRIDNSINEKIGKRFDLISDKFTEYNKKQDEACTGVECLKNDVSKLKTDHDNSLSKLKETLDMVEKKLPKTAICSGKDGCGTNISMGSSYCPGCGREIDTWGKALPGWVPYNKRKK